MDSLKKNWHVLLVAYLVIGLIYAYSLGQSVLIYPNYANVPAGGGTLQQPTTSGITAHLSAILLWPFGVAGMMTL